MAELSYPMLRPELPRVSHCIYSMPQADGDQGDEEEDVEDGQPSIHLCLREWATN